MKPKPEEIQLFATVASVLTILVGALVLWVLIKRASNRARAHLERVLAAASPVDGFAEMAAAQRQLTALRLIVNAVNYLLCAVAMVMVLGQINVNVGALILPASFVGAALGLGSQNLVRDMVAGLFIVFEDQFAVGDVVSINGVLGTVEEVGFRVTRLRADAAQVHYFPNGTINAVAKYPRRAVPLIALVVLEDAGQLVQAQDITLATLKAFDARFDAFAAPVEPLESSPPVAWFRYRLLVVPWRLQTVKDKVPAAVAVALAKAEIKLEEGAGVEIVNAFDA